MIPVVDGISLGWLPDDGERRALNNGATIFIPREGGMPVVGDPPLDEGARRQTAQYAHSHVRRAFSFFQGRIAQTIRATGQFGFTPRQLDILVNEALRETATPRRH